MATAKKTAKPEAPKTEEKAATPAKAKEAKKVSVLSDLDSLVGEAVKEVEKAVKQVGGDIARGLAEKAIEKLREATDLLTQAEREDR